MDDQFVNRKNRFGDIYERHGLSTSYSCSIRSDESPHFCFDEGLRIVTVELSKFKQKRDPTALLDLREGWCYLLKESGKMGEREGTELSRKGRDNEGGHVSFKGWKSRVLPNP